MAASLSRLLLLSALACFALSATAQYYYGGYSFTQRSPPQRVNTAVASSQIVRRLEPNHGHRRHQRRQNRDGNEIPPPGMKNITKEERDRHPKHPDRQGGGRKRQRATLPTAFDARKQWPQCASLSKIRDQGSCGTCWAVSGASVLSDRICVSTAGAKNDYASGWQAAGCSNLPSTDADANCNDGGMPLSVFQRAALYGMNSGGEYNSNVGCVPYQVTYSDPPTPIDCKTACTNTISTGFPADNTYHYIDSSFGAYLDNSFTAADNAAQVNLIKTEISTRGSVATTIDASDAFANWAYVQNGVPAPFDAADGGGYYVNIDHAVRLVGWNKTAAGVEYWIGANSWGTSWFGDQGFFYITTGKNTNGIEQTIQGPIVDSTQYYTCSAATFCTQPIDQAVQMDYSNPSAPIYLFQGNCILQVTTTASGVTKVGSAVPIPKNFVMGMSPPVTSWTIYDGTYPTLTGPNGGAYDCQMASGTTKYSCQDGSSDVPQAYTVINSTRDFRIINDGNILSGSPGGGWYTWALSPTNFFTGNGMATVTGLLKLSTTKILAFGKSSTGAAVTGLLDYSQVGTWSGQFTWATKPTTPSTFLAC